MRLELLRVITEKEIQSTPFIVDTVGMTLSSCPHWRLSMIARVYFSQTSVIIIAWDLGAVCVTAGCPQDKS